jgi:hypothetical protein
VNEKHAECQPFPPTIVKLRFRFGLHLFRIRHGHVRTLFFFLFFRETNVAESGLCGSFAIRFRPRALSLVEARQITDQHVAGVCGPVSAMDMDFALSSPMSVDR